MKLIMTCPPKRSPAIMLVNSGKKGGINGQENLRSGANHQDDVVEIIDEAYALISRSHLNLIVEEVDTKEWECDGLKRCCPWCSIQMSEPLNG